MKTRDIAILGGIAVLAYFLLRKKGDIKLADLSATKPAPTPSVPTSEIKVDAKSPIAGSGKSRIPVLIEDIKVERKAPIFMPAQNAIPNIYDRGVGQAIEFSGNGERYYNMSGTCSENVQQACKCSVKDKTNYKLDIPTLP